MWYTFLEYCFFALLIMALFLIIRHFERRNIKIQNELRLHKLEKEKLDEINKLKSRFFANLSHEFRTLLMLINGSLDLLKIDIDQQILRQNLPLRPHEQVKQVISQERARKHMQIMQHNAQLLERLVKQLLNLSKQDTGQLVLKTSPVEVVSVLKNLAISFSPYTENKEIELSFYSPQHRGELVGIAPTGKEVSTSVMLFYDVEDKKIAKHWMVADQFALKQQLGVIK